VDLFRDWWGVQQGYGVFLVDGGNGVQIAFLLAAWFVPGRVVHLAAADLESARIERVPSKQGDVMCVFFGMRKLLCADCVSF